MDRLMFITICLASFIFLSFQILLGVVFANLFFIPLLAVSFAFLGSTLAGVFAFLRYFKDEHERVSDRLAHFYFLSGAAIIALTAILKYLPAISFHFRVSGILSTFQGQAMLRSAGVGLIATLVFFSLGMLYALVYKRYARQVSKLYFFDLAGAGLGCLFGATILKLLQLSSALILLSLFSFFAACLLSWRDKDAKKKSKIIHFSSFFICLLVLIINIKTEYFETITDSDAYLKRAIGLSAYRETWHRWNVYSRASLFINREEADEFKRQVFIVRTARARAYPFKIADPYSLKVFDTFTPTALGFLLREPRDVLILMAGVGADMIEAYSYSKGVADITGVELHPLIVKKAQDLPGYNLKEFFSKKNVRLIVKEARNFIETTGKKYDAIILSWSGAPIVQHLGVSSFTNSSVYTKEAFESYLRHLKPGGVIVFPVYSKMKIIATLRAAFEELRMDAVSKRVIIIADSLDISNGSAKQKLFSHENSLRILAKNTDFTKEEIGRIQHSLQAMRMDWIYNPYYTRQGFEICEEILKTRHLDDFLRRAGAKYNRDLSVATDDAPFLTRIFSIGQHFSTVFWYTGPYKASEDEKKDALFVICTVLLFLVFIVLGLTLIVIPLAAKIKTMTRARHGRALTYFATIGTAFIFVEIAFMQLFSLAAGDPLYAFAVVLAGLLFSTAAGSLLAHRLFGKKQIDIKKAAVVTATVLILYFLFLPKAAVFLLQLSVFARMAVIMLLIVPAGIPLGIFFPAGMKKLALGNTRLIPLAWGLNGFMSIVGSFAGVLLSNVIGFSPLLLVSAFLYATIAVYNFQTNV